MERTLDEVGRDGEKDDSSEKLAATIAWLNQLNENPLSPYELVKRCEEEIALLNEERAKLIEQVNKTLPENSPDQTDEGRQQFTLKLDEQIKAFDKIIAALRLLVAQNSLGR